MSTSATASRSPGTGARSRYPAGSAMFWSVLFSHAGEPSRGYRQRMPHRLKPADVEVRRADLADADLVGGLTERVYRQGGWTDVDYSKLLLDGRSRIAEATVLVATA